MIKNQILSTSKVVLWAKWFVQQEVNHGDICVDATVGNGNDTLFLAELVGNEGKVYGFDIQAAAIEITRKKLAESCLLDRVYLIHDSHAHMEKYLKPNTVKAVMFNLGYLPGGDHSLITLPDTTLQAVKSSVHLIKEDGLITIVCYRGHQGGYSEFECLNNYLSKLNPNFYHVLRLDLINRIKLPPVLFVVRKTKKEEE
ncbi:MAG: class I SAM-dependent methyltransferase [Thermacetogeniaceae bacterium]